MLTDEQAAQLREVLMIERRRLLRNAQEGLSFSMNRDRNIGRDSIDESMEEELFSTELRLRDREKWLLGKIASALERIEQGAADECEDCGEPIAFRRLLARPVTTFCIECKEQQEQEETSLAQAKGAGGPALGLPDREGEESPAVEE
jgi:DnaK suppressor protein